MSIKLEDIGFYTLEDKRAKNCSSKSPLWRCELLVTSRCNFNCIYCRKREAQDLTLKHTVKILTLWIKDRLRNVRFSGGEPTLWPHLVDAVKFCKSNQVKRIAISTNGSAPQSLYEKLIKAGVNDFSVSLDACCSETAEKMAERKGFWNNLISNISFLAKQVYTTVGIVLLPDNESEIQKTILFASNLGVHDIRIIPAAQYQKSLTVPFEAVGNKPILRYRLNNFNSRRPVRGIQEHDNHYCPLVLDDMAVEQDKHYPCIIYLREKGSPIGKVGPNMRKERLRWFQTHNCYKDSICRNNCLDVCIDYNNKVREYVRENARNIL